VPRERFSHSKVALETLYQNTALPFELAYVDVNSPRHVARYLRQQAAERNFQLIRRERYLSPNQARNVGLAAVTSEYVVFIDNDCEVAPGCLAALLRCAERPAHGRWHRSISNAIQPCAVYTWPVPRWRSSSRTEFATTNARTSIWIARSMN